MLNLHVVNDKALTKGLDYLLFCVEVGSPTDEISVLSYPRLFSSLSKHSSGGAGFISTVSEYPDQHRCDCFSFILSTLWTASEMSTRM